MLFKIGLIFNISVIPGDHSLTQAKAAVAKCRKVGIKTFLLTSLEGEEARSQALELGIFTKKSKTTEDIARRLGVSVEEIHPRKAKSLIVTKSEMRDLRRYKLFDMYRKHAEIIFCGLTDGQKYALTYEDHRSHNIYLFVVC